ncbi:hypothetical protein DPMN_028265 [Dreissena polymorpha]|uniref:Uncharacterized protein n=1 Tax=Dreissena polymorpha TaxID=45954 RepID=A0A9D4LYP2_DREPO|nr:hypothetical protein DPMN_028265 [Dreissena polymorpha]
MMIDDDIALIKLKFKCKGDRKVKFEHEVSRLARRILRQLFKRINSECSSGKRERERDQNRNSEVELVSFISRSLCDNLLERSGNSLFIYRHFCLMSRALLPHDRVTSGNSLFIYRHFCLMSRALLPHE